MKKLLWFGSLFFTIYLGTASTAYAIDGIYLGGQVGYTALSGNLKNTYNNAIGFGIDLGLVINPVLDVMIQSQFSPHAGGVDGLKIYSDTMDAYVHLLQANDFDVAVQAGPGFYFIKDSISTESKFGINLGVSGAVAADENIRIGLDWRYHFVFDSASPRFNYWTTMMRVGYVFPIN